MNLHWKRNGFRLQYQIVLAINSDVDPLTIDERGIVADLIRMKVTDSTFRILKLNVGERWVELFADSDPGIDPTKKVSVIKGDLTTQINALRGGAGPVPLWVPQYVIVSLGDQVDAQEQAAELESRINATSKGKGRK